MALVTSVTVVFVSAHIFVLVVHFRSRVTLEAGEDREVARIGVALGTRRPFVAMPPGKDREVETVVLSKGGSLPGPGVVTDFAILRETSRPVVGIICRVVVISMAGPAVRGCSGKAVTVTSVTIQVSMGTGQREEAIVVEYRSLPRSRRVTHFAVGGETGLDVIRIVRALIVLLVTTVALGRGSSIAVGMACLAIQSAMSSGQTEELIVIEICTLPRVGAVANLAIGRKSRLDVIRIGRCLVVLTMAGVTVGGCAHEATLMAIRTVEVCMTTTQGKEGVIEIDPAFDPRRLPRDRGVAELTLRREVGPTVIGSGCLLVLCRVARETLDGRECIFEWRSPSMTTGTVNGCMRPGERKQRGAVSIPHLSSIVPGGRDVTAVASKSQLAAMSVEVTIGASRSHLVEFEDLMATDAFEILVAES